MEILNGLLELAAIVCSGSLRTDVRPFTHVLRGLWCGKSDYVFPQPKTLKPFKKMFTTSWKQSWEAAGLPMGPWVTEGVHNLKHTCGRRLRTAGVQPETRKVCLGHRNGDITTHYSAAEVKELIDAFETLCQRREGIVLRPR